MATKQKPVATKDRVAANGKEKEKPLTVSAPIAAAEISVKRTAERAFHLWQKRGCPIGDDQHDWYQAEREV